MKFSERLWDKNKDVYDAIINHPFNKKLMDGSLEKEKFAYYIEQDEQYLKYFSKALAIISTKMDEDKYIKKFLDYALLAIASENELVHEYFRNIFNFHNTGNFTTANIGYCSFIINMCYTEPVEVAIASVLPCFWIYKEVGSYINKNAAVLDNPYQRWIDTYSADNFVDSVSEMLNIIDEVESSASDKTSLRMIEIFDNAFMWEYHFWNDAYNFEDFKNYS